MNTPDSEHIKPKTSRWKKSKLNFFNKIAMLFTHIAAIALLVSYLSPRVSPENFWMISFFGLAYPFLLLINVIFFIYWLIQLKKRSIYPLLIILAGWGQLKSTIQFNFSTPEFDAEKSIKVFSYNVKVFDLYNWTNNVETRDDIFDMIKSENADVMCFQEFFSRDTTVLNNMDSLLKLENAHYAHAEYTVNDKHGQHFGIATFSKYPIVNKGKIKFSSKNNNLCIYTDLKIGDDTVRVYNMHLQSIAFTKGDYKYAEDLQKNVEAEDIENSKNILRRLKRAFVKRADQADLIHLNIEACPYPVIVCGDFNDTPSSYTYNTIGKDLKDAFVESGSGTGRSYVGAFPSFRIDYILHSPTFDSYNYQTIQKELSDHFPITTHLVVNNK